MEPGPLARGMQTTGPPRKSLQQHSERPGAPGRRVAPCPTSQQSAAQNSSVSLAGRTPGLSLALSPGPPLWFLPLTSFCSTACLLCFSPEQPGLTLASGALCPDAARSREVLRVGFRTKGQKRQDRGHAGGGCVPTWLPSGDAGTGQQE